MYFYNLIKKYDEALNIFVDMDGVIADYDFGKPLDFKNKRPIKTNIKILERISKLDNVNLYILSICKKNEEIDIKNKWLDKYSPYFKKENRIIISKENKDKSSKELKYEYLKKHIKDNKKNIVIDDDNEILKYLHKHLQDVILFQDSSIID